MGVSVGADAVAATECEECPTEESKNAGAVRCDAWWEAMEEAKVESLCMRAGSKQPVRLSIVGC